MPDAPRAPSCDPAAPPARAVVTPLTAAGRGAIASISIQGADALRLADQRFVPRRGGSLAEIPEMHVALGEWVWEAADHHEEVVAVRRGPQCVEVHCHGGRAAVHSIVASLVDLGAREGSARDWLAAQSDDRLAAAADLALLDAPTERTAAVLLDQRRGALRQSLQALRAALDGNTELAGARLRELCALIPLGRHLTRPWQVVFAGPPNAGKSSLINRILGYPRAIVFPRPGTTRDVLATSTALDGWPVELSDTAGLRHSADHLEQLGMGRAREQVASADLVVWIEDAAGPGTKSPPPDGALVALNKVDLKGAADPERPCDVRTSAVTGEGIEELQERIVRRLVPHPPAPGTAVPFDERQFRALQEARQLLIDHRAAAAAKSIDHLLAARVD